MMDDLKETQEKYNMKSNGRKQWMVTYRSFDVKI